MKVTSNKDGWNRLKRSLLTQQQYHTKVGWFGEQRYGPENDNLPFAQIAAWNEFGGVNGEDAAIPSAITPPRPFMRVYYVEELKDKNVQTVLSMVGKILFAQGSVTTAMNTAGPIFTKALQETMMRLDSPPNSQTTIDMKGFDDPLYNTGQLIMNVEYKVSKKGSD